MKTYQASLILKSAFARIKKQNAALSIRGLAVKLKVSHVFLGRLLAGKAPVPENRLKDVVKVFQLDPFAEKELKDAMIADLSAHEKIDKIMQVKKKSRPKKAVDVYEELPVKHQTVLENWYELPILDYLTCENLPKDTESIARNLSLKPSQVILVLKKLFEAQLIEKTENGEWRKKINFLRFPSNTPTEVLKKYYTDVLRRAAAELNKSNQDDYERRLIINFSIATQAEKIPEVKERLSQFLYDLSLEMTEGATDQVYHLTLGLVPLTSSNAGKKNL